MFIPASIARLQLNISDTQFKLQVLNALYIYCGHVFFVTSVLVISLLVTCDSVIVLSVTSYMLLCSFRSWSPSEGFSNYTY